jgi:hypothetical protein
VSHARANGAQWVAEYFTAAKAAVSHARANGAKSRHRWQHSYHQLRTAIGKTMDRRPARSRRPDRRRQALRAVVPMTAETGSGAATVIMEEARWSRRRLTMKNSPKIQSFVFWPNNRGDNLSKRVKNRTGGGKKGTSKLCPRRRGKFQSSKGCSARSSRWMSPLRRPEVFRLERALNGVFTPGGT